MWVGDLEANGLLDTATTIWCGVFIDTDTGEQKTFSPLDGPDYLNYLLEFINSREEICFHNGIGYDFPLMYKIFGEENIKCKPIDSLLLSRLFWPDLKQPAGFTGKGTHSIEAWGFRFGLFKPEHEDWSRFSPEMLHRCTEDTRILAKLWHRIEEWKDRFDYTKAIPLTHKLFSILQKQEEYGWLFDYNHAMDSIRRLTRWIDKIDRVIIPRLPFVLEVEESKINGEYRYVSKPFKKDGNYSKQVEDWIASVGLQQMARPVSGPFTRIRFRRTNIESDKELKEFLLASGWEPEQWNVSKSTGERTSPKMSLGERFEGITSRIGSLLVKRVQCRHRRSQLQGWVDRLREDGRIPARVSGLAATGRATHANIVNVPGADSFFGKEMRQCFICPPGKVIVGTDSAGCQNRMLAARVGDEFFTRTLLEGRKEDKTSIHFVNQKAILDRTGIDVPYNLCKNINYATLFGASDKKVGSIINRGPDVGAELKAAIFGVAPGFQKLVDDITNEWRRHAKRRRNKWGNIEYYNGYVTGLDGRPIFIDSEHKLLVYVLQSDEAIMMSAAYCYLYSWATKAFGPHGKRWAYLIWYHDEYQAEVDEDISRDFAKLAEEAIVKAGKFYNIQCPHKGESAVGKSWFETH